jgi:mRNA interferase RelE/StbE
MSYKLKFLPSALTEWRKLDPYTQGQFKAQLEKRLENPHVPTFRLKGYSNYYKIKLRSVGYRLVYEFEDKEITVYVINVGRRDTIYKMLKQRRGYVGEKSQI